MTISHTCCADYNLVQDYTLCCIAYTEWYYTKGVNCQNFTQKGINFCVHSGKIYTGQTKFTQAPPVVPLTNMRYDYNHTKSSLVDW